MKKILSVILGLALCCMLAALPVCAEETAAPVQAETAEIGDGHVTLVSDSDQLIPVYVDEEAEGAEGTVEQAMADFSVGGTVAGLVNDSGIYDIIKGNWKSAVMILISFVLLYLAIVKQFEPLLLMPIAFGMLLTNLPLAGIMDEPIYEIISNPTYHGKAGIPIYNGDMLVGYQYIKQNGGLLYYLYQGVKLGIFPPLIFMGVGAMTDFGPLIANPMSLLLGAAAQLGIFLAFIVALFLGFTPAEAGAIGIIGGADGPTAIYVTTKLAPGLLGPIAIAAYSYMALVPVIQPPIMKALTSKKDRQIVMGQLRTVSKTEKIVFPIVVTVLVSLMLPSAAPLIGCADAGQPVQGIRRDGAPLQDRAERTDEHRHHLPGRDGRRDGEGRDLPAAADPQDHRDGRVRVRRRYGRRRSAGRPDVQALRRQDQSADRLCGRFRRADGRACLPEGWSGGEPEQLPADARHGSERGRRYRLCGCGGRVHLDVRLTDLRSVSLPPKFAESEGLCTRERSCA